MAIRIYLYSPTIQESQGFSVCVNFMNKFSLLLHVYPLLYPVTLIQMFTTVEYESISAFQDSACLVYKVQ